MSRNFQQLYKEKNRKNERSHRANVLVELRNERREDMLQKKRLEPTNVENTSTYDVSAIENAIIMCQSSDSSKRAQGILLLRSAIYSDMPECDTLVSSSSFTNLMLSLLNDSQNHDIQFEAACVLANLTLKYPVVRKHLTNDKSIKILFINVDLSNVRLCETILWTIANLIMDNPGSIRLVISNNIMSICQQIISKNPPVHILKNISYFFSNFTAKSVVNYGINPGTLSQIIPMIKKLMCSVDEKILSNCLWFIANVNDTSVENIAIVIESGVLQPCKEILIHSPNVDILHPALRIFGNIVTNEDEITQYILDMGLLPIVASYIHHNSHTIQRECLWFISNIAAGNNDQMNLIFENNLIGHIMDRFMHGSKIVVRESLWVLSNILYTGKPIHIQSLLNQSLIEKVCKVLSNTNDPEIIKLCFEVFTFSFDNSGLKWSDISSQIEHFGGLDLIEQLQDHANKEIRDNASLILDHYMLDSDSYFDDSENSITRSLNKSGHTYEF